MKLLDRLFHFVETLPTSDRFIFKFCAVLSLAMLLWTTAYISTSSSVSVPENGGSLVEGVIGTPRFINPLLAVSSADKDLTALVYSGLMRLGKDGVIVPDLAESLTISDDGLTYNIVLKKDVVFHDKTELTSDDVSFTISRIQDPALKSPLQSKWEGVSFERIGDHEFNFVLPQPYAPFIENLTVGIIPKHIWESASVEELPFSEFNSNPIGSGPYKINNITRNRSGIPNTYSLVPFNKYYGNAPHIEHITLNFYQNEQEVGDALLKGEIESAASLSAEALDAVLSNPISADKYTVHRTPLPRTFTVFFNQTENPIFKDIAVRKALDTAIDRSRIVEEALGGLAIPIDSPIPPGFGLESTYTATSSPLASLEEARQILSEGGWRVNETTGLWKNKDGLELTFDISTANTPSFEAMAEILRINWSDLGIPVDIKKFEQTDLTQTIIRPRSYEALLFGTALGRELDFYSFWHSSGRNDPGLNVALYANLTTDMILADTRAKVSFEERKVLYEKFRDELRNDIPALFLFVPEFTYITPKRLENVDLKGLSEQSERFSNIDTWYTDTEKVWPLFTSQ